MESVKPKRVMEVPVCSMEGRIPEPAPGAPEQEEPEEEY